MNVRVRSKRARRRTAEPVIDVPPQSFILPPEPGPCRKRACKRETCTVHCRDDRAKQHRHELEPTRMGWARGRGDGRFDVTCRLCGEVGQAYVDPNDLDVDWGAGLPDVAVEAEEE